MRAGKENRCINPFNKRRIVFVISFFILFVSVSKGQVVSKTDNALIVNSGIIFKRYADIEGISNTPIRSLFQDSYGFIWVGTIHGILRFDGYRIERFNRQAESNNIAGNWINDICEDNNGNIWIGTNQGLSCYIYKSNEVINYYNDPTNSASLLSNAVRSLHCSGDLLWIGTDKGLSIYDINNESFRSISQNPLNKSIQSIRESSGRYIWIATEEGVVHYSLDRNDYQYYPINIKANAYGDYVWDILEINKDLYIATGGNGLIKLKYNHQNLRYDELLNISLTDQNNQRLPSDIQIFDLMQDENNRMWVATEMGLAMCKPGSTKEMKIGLYPHNPIDKKSINNNIVFSLLIDKNNLLWCGTNDGLNSTHLGQISIQNLTFGNFQLNDGIRAIHTDNGKDIWIGAATQGVYKYNLETNNFKLYLYFDDEDRKNNIRKIYGTGDKLYIGTLDGLLENDNPIDSRKWEQKLDGLVVNDILVTRRNELLVGTNKGLFERTKSGSFNTLRFANMANEPVIRSIHEDRRGNIWVGTNGFGLFIRFRDSSEYIKVDELVEGETGYLGSSVIVCITEYPENVVWLGATSGLYRMELKDGNVNDICKIKFYNKEQGLINENVQGIIPDKNGNLWINSFNSLTRFKVKEQVFQSIVEDLNFKVGSHFKYSEDKLFFGHENGFLMLDPNKVKENKSLPQVYISNLKLLNENVEIGKKYNEQIVLQKPSMFTDEIVLNYKNNVITFDYTALHYAQPKRNQFKYKLEGFDNQFNLTGSENRSATYTNLDAGDYDFLVMASNNAGQWSEVPCNIKIKISPPPWKTWWAIVLYIIFINALIFVFLRLIMRQSKQKNQLKLEHQEKEQLSVLNNMKLKFFTDISHELRTPITLINGPVSELLSVKSLNPNVRSKIELIGRSSSKLLRLIDELMLFRKIESGMVTFKPEYWNLSTYLFELTDSFKNMALKKGVSLIFQDDDEAIWAYVDVSKFEKIISNLLLNAVKYSNDGGQISVSISLQNSDILEISNKEIAEDWVKIEVRDNGKGILENDLERIFDRFYQSKNHTGGTGIGLSLTKSLVDLHKGHISVKSKPNIETVFTIVLPADNKGIKERSGRKEPFTNGFETGEPVLFDNSSNKSVKNEKEKSTLPSLLLVEDEDEILEYLEQLFSKDYKVAKTKNGIEALEHIRKLEPNVIVSDIMMPEMDGLELCQKLKNDINTCHIPIILLTAKADVTDNIKGANIGADDYVTKPFSPELLLAKVASIFENRRRIIEKFNKGEGILPQNISKNPLDETFMNNVIAVINENLDNDEFTVEHLGQIVGMSRSNLFRKLKAIAGKTPIEFIYFIRLKKGMELLLERKLNISEIAYEIGFKNASSFSKSFKKQFGKSPSEYLKNLL